MTTEQKKNELVKLLNNLRHDTDLSDKYISMYQTKVKELPDWRADMYYERFVVGKEQADYKSPAVFFYRVLDHN